MDEFASANATRASYDAVAEEYAARFFGELAAKPLDRALLDAFAEQTRALGPVADLGCGPGQVARYLSERGCEALGIDLAPEMVAVARRLSPGVRFEQGSMLALDVADGGWGGLTAFYSIIHIAPDDLGRALAEFHRALRPGGLGLLAFHVGTERIHSDEWWNRPVELDFQFYELDDLAGRLESAGFTIEARLVRRPYAPIEHPSQRGYLLARKEI
ncbi:MAG TPA: class I SAM-dependent methyltransferase [Ktedonobacterales bacterium]